MVLNFLKNAVQRPVQNLIAQELSSPKLDKMMPGEIEFQDLELEDASWVALVKLFIIFGAQENAPALNDRIVVSALKNAVQRNAGKGWDRLFELIRYIEIDRPSLCNMIVLHPECPFTKVFSYELEGEKDFDMNNDGTCNSYTIKNFLADLGCNEQGDYMNDSDGILGNGEYVTDPAFTIGITSALKEIFGRDDTEMGGMEGNFGSSEAPISSVVKTEGRQDPTWDLGKPLSKPDNRNRDSKSPSPSSFPLKSKRGITNLDDMEDGGDPPKSEYLGYFANNRRRIPCYGFGHADFYQLICPNGVLPPDENSSEDLRNTTENGNPDMRLGDAGIHIKRICGLFAYLQPRPSSRVTIYCNISIIKLGPDKQEYDSLWVTYSEIEAAHQYVKDDNSQLGYKRKGKIGRKGAIEMIRTFIAVRRKKMMAMKLEDVIIPEEFRGDQPNSPEDIELFLQHKLDRNLAAQFEKEREYSVETNDYTTATQSQKHGNVSQVTSDPQSSPYGTMGDSQTQWMKDMEVTIDKLKSDLNSLQNSLPSMISISINQSLSDPNGPLALMIKNLLSSKQ